MLSYNLTLEAERKEGGWDEWKGRNPSVTNIPGWRTDERPNPSGSSWSITSEGDGEPDPPFRPALRGEEGMKEVSAAFPESTIPCDLPRFGWVQLEGGSVLWVSHVSWAFLLGKCKQLSGF